MEYQFDLVFGFEFLKGFDQRRHAFVLKLMNTVRNDIDENVRILDDFVRLFQIIFSHGCKMFSERKKMPNSVSSCKKF